MEAESAAPAADPAEQAPSSRSLGPLKMIWRAAAAYPGRVAAALGALTVTASATLAIPSAFRLIIDRGFAQGGVEADINRWFQYLMLLVFVLALG